jgi:formate hydrogenlyase subunit 3/multisubunit Na+/H+ antiporter MnhD subunit
MIESIMILLILIPLLAGILVFCLPKKWRGTFALLVTAADILTAAWLFKKEAMFTIPWAGFGIDFSLRLYHFSSFIILAASFFCLLITLYSLKFLKDKDFSRQFFAYLLISLSFVNGAVLASNLVVLLFFWEGLLVTLYGLIVIGGKQSFKTATKAFVIVGISDLCMMGGITLTGYLAGTLVIQNINLPLTGLGSFAFILLVIGAIAKAGAIPFHTWIPDAATDAPLPFMALFPATLEKLLGIYFLSRITLDMFKLSEHSILSTVLMVIGVVTIILAVMMALVQKDYKRLLSYHAISQVGYMILGIGTCLPAGIVGGIFHMLNHALYKCCLFLTGGSVEKQAGTTDLEQLGGLGRKMPLTFISFIIAAFSISGVPPFNGFFSKELIYDAALERGKIFYIGALLGSFFTAASFLKLGHAAFLGKLSPKNQNVKESSLAMLIPMILIAATCIFFGVYNYFPLNNFIQPILAKDILGSHKFYGFPESKTLVIATVLVLLGALLHHLTGVKINGSGLKAVDHIHYAPVLSGIYEKAKKRYFDPYDIGLKIISIISRLLFGIDRAIDWIYNDFSVNLSCTLSAVIRRMHAGYYAIYLIWSLLGALIIILFIVR